MHDDPGASRRRIVLFRRDYRGFSGGHLKVWHYFRHVLESKRFHPLIFMTNDSLRDDTNPWKGVAASHFATRWDPDSADILFLAGNDWEAVPTDCRVPVVNLIQGVRHYDPGDARFAFLSRRAVRLCVSEEIAAGIRATGRANGPVQVIRAGLDRREFPPLTLERDIPVLVAGWKDPALAGGIARELQARGVPHTLRLDTLPRPEFLSLLGRSTVAALVPLEREGFFLPALEAMAMGAVVVCPDCTGNRGFCREGITCFRPQRTVEAVVAAVIQARAMSAPARNAMRRAGTDEADRHSMADECRAFLGILENL